MIVKNEAAILSRCLDSVCDLMDEIIIVDTGSTDDTKAVAAKYTDRIYDFAWNNDFSAARNFSFSLANMDYIYAPDADEILDEENRKRFLLLKEALLPEIEIVQMKYRTVSEFNTVLNARTEYRPKLFKRVREFEWIDPIHETIRLTPVVFDSDIEILHMPQSMHHKRDFSIFVDAFNREGTFSAKLRNMYAKELLKTGDEKDFAEALPIFRLIYDSGTDTDAQKEAACVLAHAYRIAGDINRFFQMTLRDMLSTPCAEICLELGAYFEEAEDYEEASLWYCNAAHETSSILDVHTGGDLPLQGLIRCYESLQLCRRMIRLPHLPQINMKRLSPMPGKHSPTGMCRKNYNSLRSVLLQSATASVCGKNRTFLPQSDCAALDRCDNATGFFHDQRSRRKVPRTQAQFKV